MRLFAGLGLVLLSGCASAPKVSTIRTGGMFSARPANCALELHSGDLDGSMMLAYDVVGFVSIANANAGEPPNSPRLLSLLKAQACALGGDIVNVGLSANLTYPGTLHDDDSTHNYLVLRKKSADGPTVQKF